MTKKKGDRVATMYGAWLECGTHVPKGTVGTVLAAGDRDLSVKFDGRRASEPPLKVPAAWVEDAEASAKKGRAR